MFSKPRGGPFARSIEDVIVPSVLSESKTYCKVPVWRSWYADEVHRTHRVGREVGPGPASGRGEERRRLARPGPRSRRRTSEYSSDSPTIISQLYRQLLDSDKAPGTPGGEVVPYQYLLLDRVNAWRPFMVSGRYRYHHPSEICSQKNTTGTRRLYVAGIISQLEEWGNRWPP